MDYARMFYHYFINVQFYYFDEICSSNSLFVSTFMFSSLVGLSFSPVNRYPKLLFTFFSNSVDSSLNVKSWFAENSNTRLSVKSFFGPSLFQNIKGFRHRAINFSILEDRVLQGNLFNLF